MDITTAAKAGVNTLEVEVTNLWVNRLIGDEQFPSPEKGVPEWVSAGKPRPADSPRKTYAAFKKYKKADPLLPSGLLGPVVISEITNAPATRLSSK